MADISKDINMLNSASTGKDARPIVTSVITDLGSSIPDDITTKINTLLHYAGDMHDTILELCYLITNAYSS
jgi:hypothetical protein